VISLFYDLTNLRLFLQVVETGSITRGAGRANMTLASASERIRGMEETLGMPLFVRERHGVQPTLVGLALTHHAQTILQQLERMQGELSAFAKGLKAQIRLLCNTAALDEFLPAALAPFLASNPSVDIILEERLSFETVQAIVEGKADVGIVADSVDLAALETFPFRLDQLVVVTSSRHPLSSRRNISFKEVLDHNFVGLTTGHPLQDHLDGHAVRYGTRLKYRVRLGSFEAVCLMAERGRGIGVVPDTAVKRLQKSMAIHRVKLTDAWACRKLTICVRRFDELPMYTKKLINEIKA